MKFLHWASILCMLAFGTSYAMDSDLGSYVNVRSFGLKLAKIGLDPQKKITIKDVLKLYKHLHRDRLLALFGLDATTLDRFFDTEKLKRVIKYVTDEEPEAQKLKASAFRRSFKIPAWEQALECTNLEPALSHLIDLYYFTGSLEEKQTLIRQLQQDLTDLRPDTGQQKLKYEQFINIPAVHSLLDEMYQGKQVTQTEVLRTLYLQDIVNAVGPNSVLQETVHLGNLIPFVLSLLMAESSEGTPFELLCCLRWDSLVDDLPTLTGCSKKQFEKVIHIPNLKKLLTELQSGRPFTQQLVRSVVQDDALSLWGVGLNVEDYVDFARLSRGLNELRHGTLNEVLTDSIKLKELGELLGIDLEKAFDTSLPEKVQKHALEELFDLLTDDGLFKKIKEGARNALAVVPLLWLTYYYPYQTGSLCAAAAGLYYYTSQDLPSERTVMIMVNSAALHGSRFAKNIITTDCPVTKLLDQVPPSLPQKEALERFIRLCQEHLDKLSRPVAIISVFTTHEVLTFISTNEKFIESICTGESAHERLMMLYDQLKNAIKPEQLPQHEEYNTFMGQLIQSPACGDIVQALPHQDLLLIGEYRPQLLMRQPQFIMMATPLKDGENNQIINHLYFACMIAQQLDN